MENRVHEDDEVIDHEHKKVDTDQKDEVDVALDIGLALSVGADFVEKSFTMVEVIILFRPYSTLTMYNLHFLFYTV